ncbi:vertnin-like [Mizuhopecten yessoensis]|uniref:Vertnin n=1 Tax=Mizuhopecten yessoensis TaxID=6573 RepID=A0A210QHU1_MIZYE|nr:vertnin-like [Mizuhopecten yessoensis]OWF48333.1 Vertnin [Mizuhopecten yessoensis]
MQIKKKRRPTKKVQKPKVKTDQVQNNAVTKKRVRSSARIAAGTRKEIQTVNPKARTSKGMQNCVDTEVHVTGQTNRAPVPSINRSKYFMEILKRLQSCKDFEELAAVSVQCKQDVAHNEIKGKPTDLYIMQGYKVDETSMDLAPSDVMGAIKFPVTVKGDGNCLPRCGSLVAFGNEEHPEIRARIVMELALTETTYLDNNYLRQGTNLKEHLPELYAMYSDLYLPGVHLTDNIVREIYKLEVFKCVNLGRYMGIWQIHALANVLECPILSCYPDQACETLFIGLYCRQFMRNL